MDVMQQEQDGGTSDSGLADSLVLKSSKWTTNSEQAGGAAIGLPAPSPNNPSLTILFQTCCGSGAPRKPVPHLDVRPAAFH